jgi:hypothetical protein
MTYGKEHHLVQGAPWKRLLRFLPVKVRTALGITILTDHTADDTLLVWMEWRNRTTNSPTTQKLRVMDANGLYGTDAFMRRSIGQSNNTVLASFQITNFPRRRAALQIQWFAADLKGPMVNGGGWTSAYVSSYVYQNSSTTPQRLPIDPLAEFLVKNPAFADQPLKSRRWPTVAKADGEEFEVLAIHSGLVATGALSGSFVSNQCSEILFRIGTNMPGLPPAVMDLGDWSMQTVELLDLFGNRIEPQPAKWRVYATGANDYRMRADDGIARVPGSLWTDQDWNVRATFSRNATATLNEAHRWTTQISVPVIGTRAHFSITAYVHACAIELKSMDNISWAFGRGTQEVGPTLTVRFVAPQPGWRLEILHVQDQRGTNIAHRTLSALPPQASFQFPTAVDSKELNITFGVLPIVTVELSGKASIVRSNRVYRPAGEAQTGHLPRRL